MKCVVQFIRSSVISPLLLLASTSALADNEAAQVCQPTVILQYPEHDVVGALDFMPKADRLVTVSRQQGVYGGTAMTLWELNLAREMTARSLKDPTGDGNEPASYSPRSVLAQRVFHGAVPSALIVIDGGKRIVVGTVQCRDDILDPPNEPSFSAKGSLRVIDSQTLNDIKVVELDWGVYGLAVSADGKSIAAVGSGRAGTCQLGLWDATTMSNRAIVPISSSPLPVRMFAIRPLVFSHDGKRLYAATASGQSRRDTSPLTSSVHEGEVHIFDTTELTVLDTWMFPEGAVDWLDVSRDDRSFAIHRVGTDTSMIGVIKENGDLEKGSDLFGGPFLFERDSRIGLFAFDHHASGEPRVLIVGGLWDIKSKSVTIGFKGEMRNTRAFAMSQDEKAVGIADDLGRINVWQQPDNVPFPAH